MKSWAWASRAAVSICSRVASGTPKAMFSAMVREKRKTSCSMVEICERSDSRFHSRTSTPSTSTWPLSTSKMRLMSRVSVLLPPPVWPTMATVSPGWALKVMFFRIWSDE